MIVLGLLACPVATDLDADVDDTSQVAEPGGDDPNESGGDDSGVEDSAWVDTGATYNLTFECPPEAGYIGELPHAARTFSGAATWVIDFDQVAEDAGYVDCSYSRTYVETVEREGYGWQCPTCDWFTAGEAEVVDGYDDCTVLISTSDQVRVEHLGLGLVDGARHFWRTGGENLTLADLGEALGTGTQVDPYRVAWYDEGEVDEGTFFLTATGQFVVDERSDLEIADIDVARADPYACGWEQCNPGGPVASYTLATGGVFPNARLADSCGDKVDIWDSWGRYLVIDSAAPDCGPCITLARAEAAWVQKMADRGLEVEWITLLNASLSSVNLPADQAALGAWISGTQTGGLVLSDEGFAYAVMPTYTGRESGMSYPTMIVVSPDMTVLGWDSGFSAAEDGGDGFGPIEALIFRDAELRAKP